MSVARASVLRLTACAALIAGVGCVIVKVQPPPEPRAELSDGSAAVEAEPAPSAAPVDGPSLVSLRGDRSGWVAYRILTKEDFQAKSSYSLWGNVAHAAEICSYFFPFGEDDDATRFHAVMNPRCSFWNGSTKVVNKVGRLAGAIAGVPVLVPGELPEWYVLQHEQLHFAITEVAALRYSRVLAKLEPERREEVAGDLYVSTLARLQERQSQLDRATSGKLDERALEKWVRVLQAELKELCGRGKKCRVRTQDPKGP